MCFCLYILKVNLKFCSHALRKKCPYSELIRSAFSCIQTEYGEIRSISQYLVRMPILNYIKPFTQVLLNSKSVFYALLAFHIFMLFILRKNQIGFYTFLARRGTKYIVPLPRFLTFLLVIAKGKLYIETSLKRTSL